ncbi:hypothetical protein Acr_01g0005070 [Actinidia rufa]|uniref:Retrovirus-related Pol polyprotein from transposon TNT 1-94-like beta-barrel domain-containing protein n=1 Tax=Actinidia rufa TaxID=165716 RepID=A0A7J0E2Q4_9ERIC|nr:hypothetical protein Acr_01g0005070 [Actinidia rufa]
MISLQRRATIVMAVDESDVLLAASADEKSDWILELGNAYHLCGNKEMFSTYAVCDGGLVWMANNTPSRVVDKGAVWFCVTDGRSLTLTEVRLTEMVNTRSSGQGNRVNANTQMDELRDMMQTLVGAMATQKQLLQQHLQPPQPQQPRDQYSDDGENQNQGETSEYRGETEDPAIPTGKTIVEYETAFTNLAEYAPHLIATDEMRARRFEDGLRYEIKRAKWTEETKARIKLEKSREKSEGANACPCGKKHSGEYWRNKPDVICFYYNEVGRIRRNCLKLRIGAIVPRGNQGGGNVKPGGNRQDNQGNRSGNGNNQRQGQAFALMPGDARNDEIVVAVIPTDLIPLEIGHFDVIFGMD